MGPPPFNCRQVIRASLLRDTGPQPLFRRVCVAELAPPAGAARLSYARSLLAASGMIEVEDLRHLNGLPAGRLICRDLPPRPAQVGSQAGVQGQSRGGQAGESAGELPGEGVAGEPLLLAAILGLCGSTFYSPDRPFVWTESRLSRRVELIAVRAFYR